MFLKYLPLSIEIIVLVLNYIFTSIKAIYKSLTFKEKSVDGEIVLITGAGHGIGREMSIQYAALGAVVICWDINEAMNHETVNIIKSNGGNATGYTVDITNREKVLEIGQKVLLDVGTVTILVNNAGIMPHNELLKHTEGQIRKTFETNILAHFWMLEAFLPKMIEDNYGHIVAVSSINGLLPIKYLVPYCSTKFAVRGLMECLFEELRQNSNGKSKIKGTTVFPYMVKTGLFQQAKVRFPRLMPLLDPKDTAASIISAQRRELEEASIPRALFHAVRFFRIFPNAANILVTEFLDSAPILNKDEKEEAFVEVSQ